MQMGSVFVGFCDTDHRSKWHEFCSILSKFCTYFFDKPEAFKISGNSRPWIETARIPGNSRWFCTSGHISLIHHVITSHYCCKVVNTHRVHIRFCSIISSIFYACDEYVQNFDKILQNSCHLLLWSVSQKPTNTLPICIHYRTAGQAYLPCTDALRYIRYVSILMFDFYCMLMRNIDIAMAVCPCVCHVLVLA